MPALVLVSASALGVTGIAAAMDLWPLRGISRVLLVFGNSSLSSKEASMDRSVDMCGRDARTTGTIVRRRFFAFAGAIAGGAILAACGETGPTGPTAVVTTAGGGMTGTTAPVTAAATIAATPAAGSAVATRPVGSAVSGVSSAGGQTLVIEAFDYGYKTMGSIPGGQTRVQIQNTGKEVHHAQLMLLNPGVGLEQLGAAFQKGPDVAFGLVTLTGGPGLAAPGSMSEAVLTLKEGQYMLGCFVEGLDHLPHLAKGMALPLKVTAPVEVAAPALQVNGTINMVDFNYELPATLPLGRSMWRITNTGAQFHEISIWQLMPGKTLDDFKKFFDAPPTGASSGPPPALPMGGMQALTRGNEGILPLDLKAGEYVATCLVPDQSKANGDSHLHLGMIKGFSVR